MNTADLSFVVQGAIDRSVSPLTRKPVTQSCLENLRRYHPGAELILSTWPTEDVTGLDFDILVTSEDPGAIDPHTAEYGAPRLDNTNRQIVSTKNGLKHATRKYAAKLRSDLIFTGNDWMQYFDRYPKRSPEWKIFRERVVTSSMWARDPRCPYSAYPFHPTDWLHIGLLEDILLLWDLPLEPQPESSLWFTSHPLQDTPPLARDLLRHHVDNRRYYPEQYLWCSLLRKWGPVDFDQRRAPTAEDIRLTELSFANNLILLDPDQIPFTNHKYPYPTPRRVDYYRFISHREWERLYMTYCASRTPKAHLSRMSDMTFYMKQMYIAAFRPLQTTRQLKAAVFASQAKEQTWFKKKSAS
jgi:hypothetical protein